MKISEKSGQSCSFIRRRLTPLRKLKFFLLFIRYSSFKKLKFEKVNNNLY
jgi:hypothetical protein